MVGTNVGDRRDEAVPVVGTWNGKRRIHVADVDASGYISAGDHRPGRVPAALVHRHASVDHRRGGRNLRVAVQVPDVEAPGAVDSREDGRVDGRPARVTDVVRVVVERQQRTRVAQAPQLHRPVDRRREEVRREVDRTGHTMAVDAGDRAVVRLEDVAGRARLGAVARAGVRRAVLAADDEVVGAAADEREARGGDRPRLVVLQLQRVLRRRQHVEAPEAHLAVGRDRREAVRVRRADDVDAVDRMRVPGG